MFDYYGDRKMSFATLRFDPQKGSYYSYVYFSMKFYSNIILILKYKSLCITSLY